MPEDLKTSPRTSRTQPEPSAEDKGADRFVQFFRAVAKRQAGDSRSEQETIVDPRA